MHLKELNIDHSIGIDNHEGNMREELTAVIAEAAKEGNSLPSLKQCTLHYSMLQPLVDAGLLKSLLYLRLTLKDKERLRSLNNLSWALMGLQSLQVLDLYELELRYRSDELETVCHKRIHLVSLCRLLLPSPSFLDMFSRSTTLSCLRIKYPGDEPVAIINEIAKKFPQLEELGAVSFARVAYFSFVDDTNYLFCH